MAHRRNILAALGGALLLPACASDLRIDPSQVLPSGTFLPQSPAKPEEVDLASISHKAADALARQAPEDHRGPALVTTIADIADLRSSSTFWMVLSEQVGNRLAQRGFRVVEARLASAFAISAGGEFMLSREAREIGKQHGATVVVLGTYGIVGQTAYVSLRLVRLADSLVVATHDFSVPVSVQPEPASKGR